MYVDLKTILKIAEERNCAIPAFNVYNMESVLGVMNAAKETGRRLFSRCTAGCLTTRMPGMWRR